MNRTRSKSARMGGWLFRHRSWIPVPAVLAALALTESLSILTGLGVGLILVGEGLRMWGVSHLGPTSRAREATARKLCYTGPYELSRNPIYMANWLMFTGIGLASGHPALAGAYSVVFALHFSLIVRFEEEFLNDKLGELYRSYQNRVPRWFGESAPVHAASPRESVEVRWERALRSERSTLLAVGLVLTGILLQATVLG